MPVFTDISVIFLNIETKHILINNFYFRKIIFYNVQKIVFEVKRYNDNKFSCWLSAQDDRHWPACLDDPSVAAEVSPVSVWRSTLSFPVFLSAISCSHEYWMLLWNFQ